MSNGDFLKTISKLAKDAAIEQLKEREFEFDQDSFIGKVKAIDPENQLDVEIKDFNLGNDRLTISALMSGPLEMSGNLRDNSNPLAKAEVDVVLFVSGHAQLFEEESEFWLDPNLDDLDLKVEVLSLEPINFRGGKELISRLLNFAFNAKKESIIEIINKHETLTKQKINI